MKIAGIKTIKIKEGKDAEFRAVFKEMVAEIRKEPGCLFFDLYQLPEDPSTYIVLEQYANQQANSDHQQSAHIAYYSPRIKALFKEFSLQYCTMVDL